VRRALGDGYELDDDRARIDVRAVHAFISGESYWGAGRSLELMAAAIRGSRRVLGVYHELDQVGFARSVSDGALIAYLADVYVLPRHRGRGLGFELVREMLVGAGDDLCAVAGPYPDVRWLLHTADAQGLYARFGFTDAPPAYALMERPRVGPAGGGQPHAAPSQ
jgi:GNAT superfamily N-acetyltransferase